MDSGGCPHDIHPLLGVYCAGLSTGSWLFPALSSSVISTVEASTHPLLSGGLLQEYQMVLP